MCMHLQAFLLLLSAPTAQLPPGRAGATTATLACCPLLAALLNNVATTSHSQPHADTGPAPLADFDSASDRQLLPPAQGAWEHDSRVDVSCRRSLKLSRPHAPPIHSCPPSRVGRPAARPGPDNVRATRSTSSTSRPHSTPLQLNSTLIQSPVHADHPVHAASTLRLLPSPSSSPSSSKSNTHLSLPNFYFALGSSHMHAVPNSRPAHTASDADYTRRPMIHWQSLFDDMVLRV